MFIKKVQPGMLGTREPVTPCLVAQNPLRLPPLEAALGCAWLVCAQKRHQMCTCSTWGKVTSIKIPLGVELVSSQLKHYVPFLNIFRIKTFSRVMATF